MNEPLPGKILDKCNNLEAKYDYRNNDRIISMKSNNTRFTNLIKYDCDNIYFNLFNKNITLNIKNNTSENLNKLIVNETNMISNVKITKNLKEKRIINPDNNYIKSIVDGFGT